MAEYNQDQVNQIFQQSLGRKGTDAEHQFLQQYVNSDQISPYQIGQYLQGTPEAQQTRLGQQQGQFQNLMTQNNNQVLGQAADAANASFAQNGRQFSSAQGNSVLQAGQQLAAQQSPMIAQFYGQGQMGLNNQYSAIGQGNLQRAYDLQDSATAYQRQMDLYNRQSNDYQNLMRQQNTMGLQKLGVGIATGTINGYAGNYASAYGKSSGSAAGSSVPSTGSGDDGSGKKGGGFWSSLF